MGWKWASPAKSHMVYMWANWAWVGSGQAQQSPTWSTCGLTAMGWKWASPCRSHMVYMWANWAWVGFIFNRLSVVMSQGQQLRTRMSGPKARSILVIAIWIFIVVCQELTLRYSDVSNIIFLYCDILMIDIHNLWIHIHRLWLLIIKIYVL